MHRDDLENVKLILTILLNYILPLADTVSHDNVIREFEYTMVTAYLSKGMHTVRAQQNKIATLKFNDFNLGDCKNHSMLTPYK
jgi:penicillin V acylase-like amidase (Ntn superfamily)